MRVDSGRKDALLGFSPVVAVCGGRIFEGDPSMEISFGDLIGSILGTAYEGGGASKSHLFQFRTR